MSPSKIGLGVVYCVVWITGWLRVEWVWLGTGGWLLVVFGFSMLGDAGRHTAGRGRTPLLVGTPPPLRPPWRAGGPRFRGGVPHTLVPCTRLCPPPHSACRKEVYLRVRGDVTPYEIGVFNKTPFSSAPPLEVTEEELAESAATPEHLGDADDASLMAGK
jgi:hypothetical protein